MRARHQLRRWAAPFAFLLAVTIAVVLVHRGLQNDDSTSQRPTTVRIDTTPPAARKPRRTKSTPKGAQYYVVQSGDTFGTIATRYGVTVTQIERLNPGISSNALVVGQRIRVK
jgi:LysM repeat protein